MFILLAEVANEVAQTTGGFSEWLDIVFKLVVIVISVCGVIGFFWRGKKGWKFLKQLAQKLDVVTGKTSLFMDKILPRLLQGLEDKAIAPKNTLADWTELISGTTDISSPKQLNEKGLKLLEDCGIKKIIDDNIATFKSDLDKANLTTALDVEEKTFYVIDARKDEDIFKPLKVYIYNNPNVDVYTCFLVGSIYLRDLYLKEHSELE